MTDVITNMFSDVRGADRAQRIEDFKSAMTGAIDEAFSGKTRVRELEKGRYTLEKMAPDVDTSRFDGMFDELTKSLGDKNGAKMANDLATFKSNLISELTKSNTGWSPGYPTGNTTVNSFTGLVPVDLTGPAKFLVPLETPLRNTIPRERGEGTAARYKRITSVTNSGQAGGASQALPFYSSTSSANVTFGSNSPTFGGSGGVGLNRPPLIQYNADDQVVPYMELGFSDEVTMQGQFTALGFEDLRGLSHTAILYAHLMGEERADLFGRGSSSLGYAGSVAAPTVASATGSSTGGTIGAGTYSVYLTSNTGTGDGLPSTVATTAALTGSTNSIAIAITPPEPTGALTYGVWVGTTAGTANAHFQGYFTPINVSGVPTITLTTYTSTSAVLGGSPTDGSFSSLAYDGFLSVATNPALTGYFARQNGTLSTLSPLSEFETPLAFMYVNNGVDIDEIWTTPAVRVEISQVMRSQTNSGHGNGYITNLNSGDGSVTAGTVVSGMLNPQTGKVVRIAGHRFMPQGTALFRSTSIPFANSNVAAPVAKRNVQDYMAIDWPQIQMTYDLSTYQIGTLVHYAPAWNGCIVGIS